MADPRVQQAVERAERSIESMQSSRPEGMVSRPHICRWSDDLSHATRDVLFLADRVATLEAEAETHKTGHAAMWRARERERERVATLETALRLVPIDDWQYLADQDLTALIDAADMQDFLSAARAALAGSEEASA